MDSNLINLSYYIIDLGLYCSGWIKRGPAGAILMTMNDAIETAESIIKDIYDGKIYFTYQFLLINNKGKLLQIAQTESTDDVLRKILQTQGLCGYNHIVIKFVCEQEKKPCHLVIGE